MQEGERRAESGKGERRVEEWSVLRFSIYARGFIKEGSFGMLRVHLRCFLYFYKASYA